MIECVLLSGLFSAADMVPLAGMVMRGPGPNLQRRAQGSENVSGLPNPDHVDHVPIRIMPSSQLGGPVVCDAGSGADQGDVPAGVETLKKGGVASPEP